MTLEDQPTPLLDQWNQTNADFPLDKCIHQLFEEQVERSPDAIAVVFEDQHLTYQGLNQRANQLAHHLISLGVKPETLVGICVERSLEMVIGLFGILKAGGAYVPLDPSYPQERLSFMLKDAQVPVLLTQENLLATFSEQKTSILCLDKDWPMISENVNETTPMSGVTPDNLAYVIYTSGSTGKPKGVAIEHRNTVMLLAWANSIFTPTQIAGVLASTSVCFDLSVFELFVPLSWGGQVILVENALGLSMLPPDCNVTLINTVPSAISELIRINGIPSSVRVVNLAGEPLQNVLVQQIYQINTVEKVFNLYGPSEDTTYSTFALMEKDSTELPSIGCPIFNTQVHILDSHVQPVPIGEVGELYLGGAGLARGYLNRPKLTAERFISAPFGEKESNVRLYKTGDLVCYSPDGNLKFLGRIDHQVKIRGFRIELGEIEAKLHQHPDIRDAVVIAREDTPGDKKLVAYLVVYQLAKQRVPMHSSCAIECQFSIEHVNKTREVHIEDISYGGIGISGLKEGCRLGQRFVLSLNLPGMKADETLRMEGNLVWLDNNGYAGIQFDPDSTNEAQLRSRINDFFEQQGMLKVLQNTFINRLGQFLLTTLPDYMVPAHFVILEELPLTPNGKIDRKALPAPDLTRPDLYTSVEEALIKIWAEVLGVERVGLHDNFLRLGGHSLLATKIVSQVNELFQLELPLYVLFEAPTIAELAERVETPLQGSTCLQIPPIESVIDRTNIPLSFAQQQLWLLAQFVPDIPVYNEPLTIRLGGPIDIVVLEKSFNELLSRHEALRTTFITGKDGQPIQIISSTITWNLPVVDLSKFPASTREDEYIQLATQEAKRPFDLINGPLFRAMLLRLDETDYRLCLTLHHIIFDGVSLYNVLFPELATLYQAFTNREPSPLPELTIQYADYVLWQRQWLQGEVIETHLNYWQDQLANLPTLQLPTDRPRTALQTFQGARHCLSLSKELTEALKTFSKEEGVTLYITMLAAFKTLLYRYSGQGDFPVGTITAGRNHAELEELIGIFLNTLVLRTDLSGNPSFKELLKRVQKITLGAYAHENLPFEVLVKTLRPDRHLSANPLFQVVFNFDPYLPTVELGWTLNQLDISTGTAKFDLMVELDERPEGIIGRIEYNSDLFDEVTIIRMAGHYQCLLEGIITDPEQSISQLPFLTIREQQQLRDWNKSPLEMCIHQLFEIQVERTPDAVAVVFENQQLTYQELNKRANQLAHYLIQLDVKPETLLGVCMERSLEMIVGILGILKAGGAYVPLDPNYPPERLAFMLEDAQIQILLTQQRLRTMLPKHGGPSTIIRLDTEWEDIATKDEENLVTEITPNNLAYVIYTSGSTGKPKGVAIEHRNTVMLLVWANGIFTPTQIAGVLASTSICFDLSIFELFVPLSWGGQVILVENALHLPKLSSDCNVTLINTVPSAMNELIRVNGVPASVSVVNLAGEPLQNALVQQIYQIDTVEKVFNLYGPSEDTTYSTFALMKKGSKESPSIGRPITNTQVHILDSHLQPVPIGVVGELYLGGTGLARGYLNRPKLTAEKFIFASFDDEEPNARLYKTGDLARYLLDGNIEFLGRIDHQVKIRGFRIELGEIESLLNQHPTIRDVVIIVREDVPGDKRLVAYFTEQQKGKHKITELRHFLAKQLPDYMVPSAFMSLESLPLTPNGKIDRKVLPKPKGLQREAQTAYVAPQSELEQTIATIWQEVLHEENISTQNTFFELGGHSLLMVQMQEKLVKALNRQIPVTDLFQYSTIQMLARYLSEPDSQATMVTPKVQLDRAAKTQAVRTRLKQSHKTRHHIKKLT
jgi:amino acid adenylation domain-containing protein